MRKPVIQIPTEEALAAIREKCQTYMDDLQIGEANEDNLRNYENDIFEAAFRAFFGEDGFAYVNHVIT